MRLANYRENFFVILSAYEVWVSFRRYIEENLINNSSARKIQSGQYSLVAGLLAMIERF
jgi:hypothetical protein